MKESESMRKILSAEKVKKLPVGTDVFLVKEGTGKTGTLFIVKKGRSKMLKGIFGLYEIKDRPGFHYEIEQGVKK